MAVRNERVLRVDDRPLNLVETDDYEVVGRLSCSAAGDNVFKTFESTIFCRPGQKLGQAAVSRVKHRGFRAFVDNLHTTICLHPSPDTHDVFIEFEVVNRTTPDDFRPRFQVIRGKGR